MMGIFMKPLIFGLILISFSSFGQIPPGYYDSAAGLSGQQLRAALQNIIDDHEAVSLTSIWSHFQTTDDKDDGTVWDMYSDNPGGNPAYTYNFIVDQCGNYSAEGDCYNREHSFPKSWFNDEMPMVTDLFHIYPTDGYVNGQRGNYPFGEVTIASWTSTNGSKVGNCSFTGYSGTVFEPIDEYKGDFSRTYFYMMTRYMDQVDTWNSDMLAGDDLAPWAKEMLIEWNANDPVSQKEMDRNNSVYQIQNNRNPFIDHPEYTNEIWGLPSGFSNLTNFDLRIWHSERRIYIESKTFISGQLRVFDLLGQLLDFVDISGNYTEFPFELNSGIYIVILQSGKESRSFKMIVAK
jgi:endonuclease I